VKEEEALKDLQEGRIKAHGIERKKGYTSHEDFAFDHDIQRVQYGGLKRVRPILLLGAD